MHAGRCRFFASAAVGREKVNWTRRYSVYILRRNWFSPGVVVVVVVNSMWSLESEIGRETGVNKSEIREFRTGGQRSGAQNTALKASRVAARLPMHSGFGSIFK